MMGRRKVTMELVEDEKARALTYKKRISGLKKKAHELSVLCDVKVCMVIIEPKFHNSPAKVDTWPSDPSAVREMIETYNKPSTHVQKKYSGVRDYFDLRMKKVHDEIARVRRENFKAKFPKWDDRINDFSPQQLASFVKELDFKLDAAKGKILTMKGIRDQSVMLSSEPIPKPEDDLVPAAFPLEYLNQSDNHIQTNALPKTFNPYDFIQAFPQQNLDYGLLMEQHSDGNHIQSQVPLKRTLNPFNHFQAFPQNNLECGPYMQQPPTSWSSLTPTDEAPLKLSLGLNPINSWMIPINKPLTMSMMKNLHSNVQSEMASSSIGKPLIMPMMASSSSNIPNNVSYTPPPSVSVSHVMSNDPSSIPVADRDPMTAMQNNVMFKQPGSYQPRFSPLSMQSDQAINYYWQQSVMPPRFYFDQIDHLPEFQSIYHNIDEDEFAELPKKNTDLGS